MDETFVTFMTIVECNGNDLHTDEPLNKHLRLDSYVIQKYITTVPGNV